MPEQRAVRLAQLLAPALALGIVDLRDVDRDHTIAAPSQHAGRVWRARVGRELEGESGPGSSSRLRRAGRGRAEGERREDQPPLGQLEPEPGDALLRIGDVREDVDGSPLGNKGQYHTGGKGRLGVAPIGSDHAPAAEGHITT